MKRKNSDYEESNLVTDSASKYLTIDWNFAPPENHDSPITPPRFWPFFDEYSFLTQSTTIARGTFAQVKMVTFRDKKTLGMKNLPTIYAGRRVALKDPKDVHHNWVQEQYNLSNEISCTLIIHPHIINYIGGVDLRMHSAQRVGVLMELLQTNLRCALQSNQKLEQFDISMDIASQIASGLNFLHSQCPHILHRDLRTPNILISENLKCKIADFGIAKNTVYNFFQPVAMYTSLIPPECVNDQSKFTTKGDIYFFAWILIELFYRRQPECYSRETAISILQPISENNSISFYKELILSMLEPDPSDRPSSKEVLFRLNSILNRRYDLELIAQMNSWNLLKEGLKNGSIVQETSDLLGRNLFHQCCIFGNLEMLEYLITIWGGTSSLVIQDKFNTTLSHLAARNGHLEILQVLQKHDSLSNQRESRFRMSPLDLSVAMRHKKCVEFLMNFCNQDCLNSALLNASQEGNLDLVKALVFKGADLECFMLDNFATPLDRACYNGHFSVAKFLIEQGSLVDVPRKDGCTPLYIAVENGHYEISKLLIENGARVNMACTDGGSTPLFMAAQTGNKELVQLLIANGAEVNKSKNNGGTPLTISSFYGFYEVVSLLLQHHADVNQRDGDDDSALDNALSQGHTKVAQLLQSYSELNQI